MKVIVAVDSFKGCLSSIEAGQAVAAGVRGAFPDADIYVIPIADGGEGTVEMVLASGQGKVAECSVAGPLGEMVTANYCVMPDGIAVLETAAAAGLTLIPKEKRNPLLTNTYGVGQMIEHARRSGCRRIYLGLGGSATCDGGTGALQALGFKFYDNAGRIITERGGRILGQIRSVGAPRHRADIEIELLCDVDAPFCGARGAAMVFAPQKGADMQTAAALDAGLASFATVAGHGLPNVAGSGAAGGLAGGLMAYTDAVICPGAPTLLKLCGFKKMIEDADLIITGEGCIDAQTMMGKAPAAVMGFARAAGVRALAVGGRVEDSIRGLGGFDALLECSPRELPLEEAMKPVVARENIRRSVKKWFVEVQKK